MFLWQVAHGKILTNAARCHRNMAEDHCCVSYNGIEESISHVLRDCFHAKSVWYQLIGRDQWQSFRMGNVSTWLSNNLVQDYGDHWIQDWHLYFGVTIWFLWTWRNERVFSHKQGDLNATSTSEVCCRHEKSFGHGYQ